MRKWEYLFIRIFKGEVVVVHGERTPNPRPSMWQFVDYAGNEGWELVTVIPESENEATYYFKRPNE